MQKSGQSTAVSAKGLRYICRVLLRSREKASVSGEVGKGEWWEARPDRVGPC